MKAIVIKPVVTLCIFVVIAILLNIAGNSYNLNSTPPTATPTATLTPEEVREQAAALVRAKKSERRGKDAGRNAAVHMIVQADRRRPTVPTRGEFDKQVIKAVAEAVGSDPDLDVNSFRTGYIEAFKLTFESNEKSNSPAF